MKYLPFSQTKLGSNDLLCAHGWVGQTQHLFSWRRISQSEIRNSAEAEKSESESEGGQKFLPPNPPPASLREALRAGLPFCSPERSVSAARSAAISQDFVQKRFELRSAIATNQDISNFQGKKFARSPRLRRGYARFFPCILELNQRGGQIQIRFFGKANGGSAREARNKTNVLYPIFSIPPEAEHKASFSCLTAGR